MPLTAANYSSADYFEMEGTDITNSSALSDWFLETYSSSPESRYGGYIFDDVLTLNVSFASSISPAPLI